MTSGPHSQTQPGSECNAARADIAAALRLAAAVSRMPISAGAKLGHRGTSPLEELTAATEAHESAGVFVQAEVASVLAAISALMEKTAACATPDQSSPQWDELGCAVLEYLHLLRVATYELLQGTADLAQGCLHTVEALLAQYETSSAPGLHELILRGETSFDMMLNASEAVKLAQQGVEGLLAAHGDGAAASKEATRHYALSAEVACTQANELFARLRAVVP
ncbi:hypothetical protein MW290_22105 [Aquincola tertiaricarbonis]|uniref:Uncharacterized protein n=1 Tax=Aquincola tertiaricarbonis TaxID=391953 RepID=A0ABY4SE80_AQUTE|nr:hypothetical protein [Aquincola tertiaricarbonis]URI11633.1 hypothetical protein MW290_22105 [Aquincola tertiaricarbonis]